MFYIFSVDYRLFRVFFVYSRNQRVSNIPASTPFIPVFLGVYSPTSYPMHCLLRFFVFCTGCLLVISFLFFHAVVDFRGLSFVFYFFACLVCGRGLLLASIISYSSLSTVNLLLDCECRRHTGLPWPSFALSFPHLPLPLALLWLYYPLQDLSRRCNDTITAPSILLSPQK